MMSPLFRISQVQSEEKTAVIKSVRNHPRNKNEQDILMKFQNRTPYLRPVLDEIADSAEPSTVVLGNPQMIYYKHIKPDKILVNYREGDVRFSEVELGDLGGSYTADTKRAQRGTPVGATIWNSPEVVMGAQWRTATDIWSFSSVLIRLVYGGDFNLIESRTVPFGHEAYGPEYDEIANQDTIKIFCWVMDETPKPKMRSFYDTVEREVCKEDKEVIGKIMKMDWRDRPTATELLADKWVEERK
ncbi:hypothetical protein EJ08DRAFT_673805 [Tothia fuscella]|uniref:Protein kinase domain-containing protein n=1 Tax=Tothia fuscella TaxID=1048955 RepID=A0A9P4NDS0_9PEZI|nr:hypothetical protein EJ08DRAFT_673805 [Tothia fuscella]